MSTDASYEEAYNVVKKRLREVLEENELLLRGSNSDSKGNIVLRYHELVKENEILIRERGDLQDAVMKRDDTIDMYRKWFSDHEHIVIRDNRPIRTQKDIFRDFNRTGDTPVPVDSEVLDEKPHGA